MSTLLRALALSLPVVLALAAASSARPPGWGGHGRDPGGLLEEHADELGLDEQTREAIRSIVSDSRESGEALRAELRGLHLRMKDLLEQDAPEREAVMALADEIGRVETSLHRHRLGALLEIRALLTPEQRKQLAELRGKGRRHALEPLGEACAEDRERLCADAEGRFERMRCMREHRDELSAGCREALDELWQRHHRHGHSPPADS